MLPFSLCNKERLANRHLNRPLFPIDTIDSVLRHQEVGRAKDVSAPLVLHQLNWLDFKIFWKLEEQNAWSANDKMGKICYKKFLMKFEIIFLLKPFSSQFNFSDVLCNILQTNALDVMFLSLQNTRNPRICIRSEVQYTQRFGFCRSLERAWQSPKKFRECSAAQYIQWRVSSTLLRDHW